MSTNLHTTQSFGGILDPKMASEISTLYGPQDGRLLSPGSADFNTPPASARRSSVPHTQSPHSQFQRRMSNVHNISVNENTRPPNRVATAVAAPMTTQWFSPTVTYTHLSGFTAANTLPYSQETPTVSPMQTCFDPNQAYPATTSSFSYSNNLNLPHAPVPANFTEFASNSLQPERTQRTHSHSHSTSPPANDDEASPVPTSRNKGTKRRRDSEHVEAGSARAIYLEKNRKAASKCRSKQRQQQEDLVEEARDVERRNRILRAEVEILKGGMRELMDIVGQHSNCSDSRLKMYVQREADRLACGADRCSPRGSQSSEGSIMSGSSSLMSGSVGALSSPGRMC